jgi:hypothetical protein
MHLQSIPSHLGVKFRIYAPVPYICRIHGSEGQDIKTPPSVMRGWSIRIIYNMIGMTTIAASVVANDRGHIACMQEMAVGIDILVDGSTEQFVPSWNDSPSEEAKSFCASRVVEKEKCSAQLAVDVSCNYM